MRRMSIVTIVLAIFLLSNATAAKAAEFRRLPVLEYISKMKAGWIGQMCGVGWGAPTEFRWRAKIIPEDKVPEWKPRMVNQFGQDDIYVEMTFMRSLELYGPEVDIRQAGIDFANSGYMLWHANKAGRDLLRQGIAPPDSGHPEYNKHADDIDYQIEADFSGLISPALPNEVIRLGEIFGRLMNYGDGLYGGQFVGGMYAEAFFTDDIGEIIQAGLDCIPSESQFAECIRDTVKWHKENPNNWEAAWQLIEDKYDLNNDYRRFTCSRDGGFNIDAKINAAYIAMGLLYGSGDIEDTCIISMRCGQDSDCNPSNALGILFTTLGMEKLPDEYVSALNNDAQFSHTPYTFPKLIEVSVDLVKQQVTRSGGKIEKNADGEEVFVIPVQKAKPSKLEQCWEPGPSANSKFTQAEMAKIDPPADPQKGQAASVDISEDVKKFAPEWNVFMCGDDMEPGLHTEVRGKQNVLVTHPLSAEAPAVLYRMLDVEAGQKTILHLVVGHHPEGDWELVIVAGTKENVIFTKTVGEETAKDGWLELDIDLTEHVSNAAPLLAICNAASGWAYEAGYFAEITIKRE